MKIRAIYCDAETCSDLDLKKVGARRYFEHPSTQILCWSLYSPAWSSAVVIEDEPDLFQAVGTCLKAEGTRLREPIVLVHWGAFDRFAAQMVTGLEPTTSDEYPMAFLFTPLMMMLDLQQLVLNCGGPDSLKHASEWAGVMKLDGQRAIKTFTGPDRIQPEDNPELWHQFMEYAAVDSEVLHDIALHIGPMGDAFRHAEGYHVVNRMNARGIPVDLPAAGKAQSWLEKLYPALVEEFVDITGGLKPTQTQKFADWLGTDNCQKQTLEDLRDQYELDIGEARAIEIRLETGGATRKKLDPMLLMSDDEDRVHDQFVYHGAWTSRFTARGMQPQNFKKTSPHEGFFEHLAEPSTEWGTELFGLVQQNIRGFIKAQPGKLFVAADFNAIELRVMAWLANEEWLLDMLRNDEDVYSYTASNLYRVKVSKETHPRERDFGKMVELACQFGLGGNGLYQRTIPDPDINVTKPFCFETVEVYRADHPAIVDYWQCMDEAIRAVIEWGGVAEVGQIVIDRPQSDVVRIIRPSGFYQCLWDPELVPGKYGLDIEYTGRLKNGAMGRVRTWGARLAQGTVQGTAADLIRATMRVCEQMGYPPIMQIHDELVTEIDDDGGDHVPKLEEMFETQLPLWAEGIPIRAEGWQGRRFRK